MYNEFNGATIVRKHWILLLLYGIKFIFILLIAFILFFIGTTFRSVLWEQIVLYIILPLIFVLINYSFLKLILWVIEFYNYLFIISEDQIFIINASLFMRNDIEIIDAFKIIKIDAYSRGIIPNIFSYGKLIIELQTREERLFRFMPKPYKLLECLKQQREKVLENRKKKYIIDDMVIDEKNKGLL